MSLKYRAAPPSDSEDDSIEEDELVRKRMKLIRELSELEKPREKFTGGIIVRSEFGTDIDPGCTSSSVAQRRGKKEVEELKRELDLKNTFSNETNRRDEDAEMNKYIEEQIRLRREAAKSEEKSSRKDQEDPEFSELFKLPASAEAAERVDDILLHTLSRNHSSAPDERSEAMLSSQMLNGIPEVDLGMGEKIRTIEATEEAKQRLTSKTSANKGIHSKYRTPYNLSSNFQYHRSSKQKDEGKSVGSSRSTFHDSSTKTVIEPVVSVGEEPRQVEYRLPNTEERRPPQRGKASDDYYLQKFKKNSRR